jgi:amino acid transporter
MSSRPRRPRPSLLLVLLLVCALSVGAAVALLTSARSAGPPPPVGPTTELVLPAWVVSAVIIAFALAIFAPLVIARIRSGGSGGSLNRFVVAAFGFFLAACIVLVLIHFFGGLGGGTPSGVTLPSPAGNNSTTPPPNGSNTPVGGPGGVLSYNLALPSWTLFLVASIALVLVAVVALPPLAEYLEDRREAGQRRRRSAAARAEVRQALRRAAEELGGALDPRATVLALYATLLARIAPMTTDLDFATAEEIRRRDLVRLGIRASAAEDLTRVFEEARYSSHPMGSESVARATAAIRAAEEDLAHGGTLP